MRVGAARSPIFGAGAVAQRDTRRVASPCWTLELACCPAAEGAEQSIIDRAIMVAAETVWQVTGRQYGLCPVEIDVCSDVTCAPSCRSDCEPQTINLSHQVGGLPIAAINAVTVDGVPVAASAFWLGSNTHLVVVPGGTLDPLPAQITIEFTPGLPLPEPVKWAAEELACQLVKRCLGAECDLPANATRITSEGVTIEIDTADGKFGLPIVDTILSQYRASLAAAIWDPAAETLALTRP